MVWIDSHSFMRQAVTISTPASALSGTRDMTGARTNMDASRASAWMMLTSRVWPPDLMPTLVRAMAAVAGTPPKKGMTMLPTPWATSSWLACRRMPVMLLATAPHSRLSTAPSAVIDRIGAIRPPRLSHGIAPSCRRSASSSVCGIAPMTGTGQPSTLLSAVARMMPSSEAGKRSAHWRGHRSMVRITKTPNAAARQSTVKPP